MPGMFPPGMAPPQMYPGVGGYDLGTAAQAAREALEKAKRAAMFQRQIQEQMQKLKTQGLAAGFLPGEGPKARKLILDEFGRELDEEGNVVPMKPQVVSTLKVNINREKEARLTKILGLKKGDADGSSFFDSTLRSAQNSRTEGGERQRRKTFRFLAEGSLVRREQRLLKKVQEKALGLVTDKKKLKEQEKEKQEAKKKEKEKKEEEEAEEIPLAARKIEPKVLRREAVPGMEWWDLPLLLHGAEDPKTRDRVNVEKITPYVEHPVPIKYTNEKETPEAAMMHLTPKERKKLRRLKRQERTTEIRDKIKMGILQPPPPKVKMSNLMRVLGDEAIADPSTVERRVRQQVEQRRKEHEQRNEARKLPAEERKQKKKLKWMEDQTVTNSVQVCVYKVKDLTNKRHLFKIDMNAQQFHLTGVCVACPGVANIIVVEGGARAVKRYRKLMTKRIKWTEDQTRDDDEDDEDDDADKVTAPKLQDHCVLIWEGVVKARNFKNWKVLHARSEPEARKTLADRGAEHYWEMLARFRDSRVDI